LQSKGSPWTQSTRSYMKNKLKQKRAEGMVQVVVCLPSKCKTLSSNPRTGGGRCGGGGGGETKEANSTNLLGVCRLRGNPGVGASNVECKWSVFPGR
jgi:hypothetical protein